MAGDFYVPDDRNSVKKMKDLETNRLFEIIRNPVPGGYILGLRKQGKGMLELLLNGG